MLGIFRGGQPDITPAQIGGFLLGGIPVVAKLGQAFGLYDLSAEEQQALSDAVTWGVIGGGALIFGDAGLRASRNAREGKVASATIPLVPATEDDEALLVSDDELPSDDDEVSPS